MGCHRNFWAIVKYIFEIHGSIFKPNKIWKSHLPFQQYMNKEPRFQISAKSDNVWRKYITFSGSRSWIYLEVAVHYTAAPRWNLAYISSEALLPSKSIWKVYRIYAETFKAHKRAQKKQLQYSQQECTAIFCSMLNKFCFFFMEFLTSNVKLF